MSGGGKSSTSTSAVTIPPEVLARYNSVNATAQNVAQTPFQPYSSNPSDFVAPVNSTQQQGINQIAGSANAAQPFFGAAAGLTAAGAGPANLGGLNTNQYMSPFMGDVYGQALAGQQLQNQQQQSNLAGQAVTAGAFGGDRANTAQANLAYQQNLANNQTNANLLNTGYQNAQNVATQQQGAQLAAQQANLARLTGAGGQLAGIGTAAQTAAQQGGQNTLGAGTVPQQTQQAGLTALYNQFLQQQAYPFQTSQFLANIAEGTGALSGSTTTQTQPSSLFSDRRLKHDIKKIGKTDDGLPIYKFKYKGDPSKQIHVGFMAQDVEKVHPEAVGESHGYKTVDYDKATRHARYTGGLTTPTGDVDSTSTGQNDEYFAKMEAKYGPPTRHVEYGGRWDQKALDSIDPPQYEPPSAFAFRPSPPAGGDATTPEDTNIDSLFTRTHQFLRSGTQEDRDKLANEFADLQMLDFNEKWGSRSLDQSRPVATAPWNAIRPGQQAIIDKQAQSASAPLLPPGGLIPHHMGGEVNEGHMGEEYARGGYALNGAVVDPSDMAAILAAQQHMYAPFSESGMGITGNPGAGRGIVPAANLPVPKLVTANTHFTQQPTGMQQIKGAVNAGNMVSDLYYGGKKGLLGAPAGTYTQDGKTYQQAASTGALGAGGNYDPKKGWFGPSDAPAAAAPAQAAPNADTPPKPEYRGGLVREHHANGNAAGDNTPYDNSTAGGYMSGLGLSGSTLSPQQLKSEQADMAAVKMPGQPPSGAMQGLEAASALYGGAKLAGKGYDAATSAIGKLGASPAAYSEPIGPGMANMPGGLLPAGGGTAAPAGVAGAAAPAAEAAAPAAAAATPAIEAGGLSGAAGGAGAAEAAGAGAADAGAAAAGTAATAGLADTGATAAEAALIMLASRGGVVPRAHRADGGPADLDAPLNTLPSDQAAVEAASAPVASSAPQGGVAPTQTQEAQADVRQPRSVRNNNPGNISDGPFARSMPGYAGSDGRFAIFQSTEHGFGAMDQLLSSYGSKGLVTPTQIISRWAPASDNNNVGAYAGTVAKQMGIGPNDAIDMSDPNARRQLSMAMASVEGGGKIPGQAPAPSGGVMPSMRATADDIANRFVAPSPGAGPQQGGKGGEGLGGLLKSEKFWIPLLSGLGTMASSNSRYLGSAVLQGLGGAANSYANLEKQQSALENQQAQTQKTYSDIGKNNYDPNSRMYTVKDPVTGKFRQMLLGEYLDLYGHLPPDQRPTLDLRTPASIPGATSPPAPPPAQLPVATSPPAPPPAQLPGATSPPARTGQGQSKIESSPLPPPAGPPKPDNVKVASPTAPTPAAGAFAPTPEEVAEGTNWVRTRANYGAQNKEPDFYTDQSIVARDAGKTQQLIVPLAKYLASVPREGLLAPGPLQEVAKPVAGYLNNLAAILGKPGMFTTENVQDASSRQEVIDKYVTQLQGQQTSAAQQHALAALQTFGKGIPGNLNQPGAMKEMVAQIMTNNYREIDRNDYFDKYRKLVQGGNNRLQDVASESGRLANANFEHRFGNDYYEKERNSLSRMFGNNLRDNVVLKQPDGTNKNVPMMAYLASGPQLTQKARAQISEKYGPNILRHFGIQ